MSDNQVSTFILNKNRDRSGMTYGSRIMIFAPHEDDEVLTCAGVIRRAVLLGAKVKLVMVTTGDYGDPKARIQRTINAMSLLGLDRDNIEYLGYGDLDVLGPSYLSVNNPKKVFSGIWGTQTYGFSDIGIVDYHYKKYGVHAAYTRENIFNDIYDVIMENLPQHIYAPSQMEFHPDHCTTALYVMEAVINLSRNTVYSPVLHEYMVYKEGMPQDNLNALEPISNLQSDMDASSAYSWSCRESIPVPAEMYAALDSGRNLKSSAFDAYGGEVGIFRRFIKSDEVFWSKSLGNLAYNAVVTTSSENTSTGQTSIRVIDGISLGYPYQNALYNYFKNEWATVKKTAGAWIQLTWPESVKANRIVLYDRPNFVDRIIKATLSFSDGTTLGIGPLPNNGGPYKVDFNTKTISWVKLVVDEAEGENIGLSEFEVFNKISNIAPEAVVSVSSHNTLSGQLGMKAADGVVDGWPGDYTREWATLGETTGAWIRLDWQQNYAVSEIVLYDRRNPDDHIKSGVLTFSDGSSIEVGELPNDGTGMPVTFPEKTIEWVKFAVTQAEGYNIGLAEIQVYGYPMRDTYSNIAPISRVTVSSEETNNSSSHGLKAVDGRKSINPYEPDSEWITSGEKEGAWIKLDWERPYKVKRIVLYDRPSPDTHISDALLNFSDGASLTVGELPNDGSGKIISLNQERTIKWVKLTINKVQGETTGLSEFEVYGEPAD